MKTHLEHLKYYIPDLESMKILDLGSGRGAFLVGVAKKGGTVFGIEPYDEYIKLMN